MFVRLPPMSGTFTHPEFERYEFESVPLDRDLFLMEEEWIPEWERAYLDFFNGDELRYVGYISYAAARSTSSSSLEISWYPNIFDRFHEVRAVLPRDAFVACIDVPNYDEKPHIFVKSEWLNGLHLRPYSAFALIDAIGVKNAIRRGELSGDKLTKLRDRIDYIAASTPGIAFISFADNVLLKVNWFVGTFDSKISYSYDPETLIRTIGQVATAYKDILGMSIYATVTQGVNEYIDNSLIHLSSSGQHISLNSLGLPFAQLLNIDEAARDAIRSRKHTGCELYIDELFFNSLRFNYDFDKQMQPSMQYPIPMSSAPGKYFYTSINTILSNLDPTPSQVRRGSREA